MKIILASMEGNLSRAWERHCGDLDCVSLHDGSILDADCDAVVSPANSYGFMDGGIDQIYSQHFGWHVQQTLQQVIQSRHGGQLLVGQAELVATEDNNIPWLIAAPTMRVPEILTRTVNPYLACRAVLRLIQLGIHGDHRIGDLINTVAIPGLGTGVGRVEPDQCARQVRHAIREVVYGESVQPDSWVSAQAMHLDLIGE